MANQFRPITEEELKFIEENCNKMKATEIAAHLGRSNSFVYKELHKLNEFSTVFWTDEQVEYLKNNYLLQTYEEIGKAIDKSESAIQCRLRKLGLSKDDNCKPWTEEQDNKLKELIDHIGYTEMAPILGRTPASIAKRARRLGLVDPQYTGCRKLRKAAQLFIVENYMKYTDAEFAEMFNASVEAVEEVRKKHGKKKTGNEIKGKTYIERKVANLLDELSVVYTFDEKKDGYRFDFLIEDKKIVIEVHGDYWHCNPRIYGDGPKDDVQIRHIVRDYYKKCYLISRGYQLIEVLEADIKDDWEEVKEKIRYAVLG